MTASAKHHHAITALQNRSRFCEGSMNDRTSAAPPVRFLGPEALAALEQPVSLTASSSSSSHSHRVSQDGSSTGSGSGFSQTWSRKTGSRLFGQVWEGVRGKLRLRRDDHDGQGHGSGKAPATVITDATTTTAVTATTATAETPAEEEEPIHIYTDPSELDPEGPPATRTRSKASMFAAPTATTAPMDIPARAPPPAATAADFRFTGFDTARPSRDEVLARYNHLMANGFFQQHAIHSSRQHLAAPPGASLPTSMSAVGMRPATARGDFHHRSHTQQQTQQETPPQWPLSSPRDQQPFQSPTSVSSRGTKRAAIDDDEDEENANEAKGKTKNDNASNDQDEMPAGDFDKENLAPPHPNTVKDDRQPKKRLRRIASRDSSLFMPKLRSSSGRRSLSTSNAAPPSYATASSSSSAAVATTGNKLQKRRGPPVTTRGLFDMPARYQSHGQAPRPRHVSDGGGSARVLRGRAAEDHRSLRIVPDADRGIPGVPAIPPKFTYGEDRQSNGPWRGLRIR